MERKNTILLTVIAIATLLVAVVGATFAYFTATITDNRDGTEDKGQTNISSGSVAETVVVSNVEENAGKFTVADVYPGHKEVAALAVKVTSETSASSHIQIVWNGTNGFPTSDVEVRVYKKDETLVSIDASGNQDDEVGFFKCKKQVTSTGGEENTQKIQYSETCSAEEETTTFGDSKPTTTPLTTGQITDQIIYDGTLAGSEEGKDYYFYVVVEYKNNGNQTSTGQSKELKGKVSVKLAA